jgi:uncharacterized protein
MRKFYTFIFLVIAGTVQAQTYHLLSGGAFTQNWTNTNLITVNDNWSGVPSMIGYRGDDIVTTSGVDPQTILAAGTTTPVNVFANQSAATTSGGLSEIDQTITNPTIGIQGSNTGDAPFLLMFVNTTGITGIRMKYLLRDLDASVDNSTQPIALQYRIGNSGDFTNIPAAFVADASGGPSLATLETPVNIILPAACNNQAELQLRIITANAVGNDELIGIDDIEILQDAPASVNNIIRNPNYVRIAGNPGGDLNIQFNEAVSSEVHVQFFSANGEIVLQKRLGRIAEGQVEKFSLANLPKGLYILSIRSKEGTFTTKVVN